MRDPRGSSECGRVVAYELLEAPRVPAGQLADGRQHGIRATVTVGAADLEPRVGVALAEAPLQHVRHGLLVGKADESHWLAEHGRERFCGLLVGERLPAREGGGP